MVWAEALSSAALSLSADGATVTRAGIDGDRAASLVPVPRGGSFELAVVVERMPKSGYPFYFGAGRAMPRDGAQFGTHGGTCGLRQHGWIEGSRFALAKGFGTRTDRADEELGPQITAGTRLALQLSPVGVDGYRTLRFFVDGAESASFKWIVDDGKSKPWVAGCNPSEGAVVRLAVAEGSEIWTEESGREHAHAYAQAIVSENLRQLSLGLGGDIGSRLRRAEAALPEHERAVVEAAAAIDEKHKAAEALAKPPPEFETGLRAELQKNFDVDAWPTCGRSWKQCREQREESGEECEHCRQGGNLLQMHAACREFNAALSAQSETGAGYPEGQIDDLVAVRIFTRRQPYAVCDMLNAAARQMDEPHDPPPEPHRSMFVHLRRACHGLPGARQQEPLYRGQRRLHGESKRNLKPEDPRQYEEGSIVQWRAFTVTSREQEAARARATAGRQQGQGDGVLFVIEPPHAWDNLGVHLVGAAADSSDETTAPLAVSAAAAQSPPPAAATEDDAAGDYAFDVDAYAGDDGDGDGAAVEAAASAETQVAGDQVLLPPGSAFRVLSNEVEEQEQEQAEEESGGGGIDSLPQQSETVGGLRVIRLRHLGAWVDAETYARPEIALPEALEELKEAKRSQAEHAGGVEALRRKITAMENYDKGVVGCW